MRNDNVREVSAAIAARDLGDCDTYELPLQHVLAVGEKPVSIDVLDRLTGGTAARFGMPDVLIAIPTETIREAGWISGDEYDRDIDEARDQAARDARADATYGLGLDFQEFVRLIECGAIEDAVSPTDLLLYGPAIAIARAALSIALEHVH